MFTAIGLYVYVNIVFMLLVHYTGLFLPPLSYLIEEAFLEDKEIQRQTKDFSPEQISLVKKISFVLISLIYWLVFVIIIIEYFSDKK